MSFPSGFVVLRRVILLERLRIYNEAEMTGRKIQKGR